MDAVQICDGGSAEFHHDACHFASTVPTCFAPQPDSAPAGADDQKAETSRTSASHRFGERKVGASLSGSGSGVQWEEGGVLSVKKARPPGWRLGMPWA
ncbi:hypothetical protein AOX55_00002975 [Sinorhizobium fredii CCBAU 25509]|nr:hypothetical protein AOX55_00002975 [Sinorhizobium fredii CCBAU 25509]